MKELIRKYGLILVALGMVLIALVVGLEHNLKHVYGHMEDFPTLVALGLKFGDHLGIAFLSIGIIGLLFEVKEWRERFYKEIEKVVNNVDHLTKLAKDELQKQQVVILKAIFHNQEIDKDGGFLNFYFTKIQQYIGKPYREETKGVTVIEYQQGEQGETTFLVKETISYRCLTLGEYIEDKVRWTTKKDEIKGIKDFSIRVRVPEQIKVGKATDYPHIAASEMTFKPTDSPALWTEYRQGHGYTFSLEDYKSINRLFVETSVTYVVDTDRALTWSMPYPSKGLTGEIRFPPDLKIYVDPFWIDLEESDEKAFKPKEEPGLYTYTYPSWLLPGDGFVFQLRKQDDAAATGANSQAARPKADHAG